MSESIIKVIGVGGGGSNAVNHMYRQGIQDVDFVVANTDIQALLDSPVPVKVQLGKELTGGRGAGNIPEKGKESAVESLVELEQVLSPKTRMVFITAGMGGGTGTGAAPIIAEAAHEKGILTVGIVTIPFRFEGQKRLNQAIEGIKALKDHVDSLLVINNEKLREIHGDLTLSEAFARADDVLTVAAKGIAEIITVHGYVNVDFADVQTVMKNSGVAIMGSARAAGPNRAQAAISQAINSPLLNNNNVFGASNVLLHITSGTEEASMGEIAEINDFVQDCAGSNANVIWGNGTDESLGDDIAVTVIATGFNADVIPELYIREIRKPEVVDLYSQQAAKARLANRASYTRIADSKPAEIQPDNPPSSYHEKVDMNPRPTTTYHEVDNSLANTQASLDYTNPQLTDELESVPAYKRKGLKIDDGPKSGGQFSRYSLQEDDEGNVQLRKNPFLHDKVD